MKCSYHPAVDSQEFCSTCSKALCSECSHRIKGKVFCQDCLVRGAEWAAAVKDFRIPTDAPKRAASLSLIPGIGAVYNGEYQKALIQFAVFAALCVMGDSVHGVFGFGAFVFLIYTMFDSYRTAESHLRARLDQPPVQVIKAKDRSAVVWGVVLICLGMMFLLRPFLVHFYYLNRLWPLAFIALGAYLIYISVHSDQGAAAPGGTPSATEHKE